MVAQVLAGRAEARMPASSATIAAFSRSRAMPSVWGSPATGPATVLHDVVTTVFPADCRSCGGPLVHAGSLPVCAICLGSLAPEKFTGCLRCGEAADLDLDMEDVRFSALLAQGLECRVCRMAPPEFTRAVSFGTYDDELRNMIHLLKFEGVRPAARPLGACLAQAILQLHGIAAQDALVIAVPLHPARERQRGYNQSVLLAGEALRRLRRSHPAWRLQPADGALIRKRRTESQFALSPRGRRANLRGAFAAAEGSKKSITGREILLVDDILTSGATARECARVLLAAGAARVWVATVARAQKRYVKRQHEDPGELVAAWDLSAETG
jgi:ComF family protein